LVFEKNFFIIVIFEKRTGAVLVISKEVAVGYCSTEPAGKCMINLKHVSSFQNKYTYSACTWC
jgi:hypothetical protein